MVSFLLLNVCILSMSSLSSKSGDKCIRSVILQLHICSDKDILVSAIFNGDFQFVVFYFTSNSTQKSIWKKDTFTRNIFYYYWSTHKFTKHRMIKVRSIFFTLTKLAVHSSCLKLFPNIYKMSLLYQF